MPRLCTVGSVKIGHAQPLAIIAGPCVLESYELGLEIGTVLRDACRAHGLQYVFKASFDKANRSHVDSPRGPGLKQGLLWLERIGRELDVPTTTDIHEPAQAEPAAGVIDLLQVPAFLCRQTDLLFAIGAAAAKHKRAVNIKKGQFLSPAEMAGPVGKLRESGGGGCDNIILTERGTFFGYGRLVNDFLGLAEMMELDSGPVLGLNAPATPSVDKLLPVCFDCTHSTQRPGPTGGAGNSTGGNARLAPMLAKAATAAGVHALFLECHPDPKSALSDAATMLPLATMPGLLKTIAAIRHATTTV